jgi:hypothetical protein
MIAPGSGGQMLAQPYFIRQAEDVAGIRVHPLVDEVHTAAREPVSAS